MFESLLFLMEVIVATYACWVVLHISRKEKPTAADLKLFAFKSSEEQDRK